MDKEICHAHGRSEPCWTCSGRFPNSSQPFLNLASRSFARKTPEDRRWMCRRVIAECVSVLENRARQLRMYTHALSNDEKCSSRVEPFQ